MKEVDLSSKLKKLVLLKGGALIMIKIAWWLNDDLDEWERVAEKLCWTLISSSFKLLSPAVALLDLFFFFFFLFFLLGLSLGVVGVAEPSSFDPLFSSYNIHRNQHLARFGKKVEKKHLATLCWKDLKWFSRKSPVKRSPHLCPTGHKNFWDDNL